MFSQLFVEPQALEGVNELHWNYAMCLAHEGNWPLAIEHGAYGVHLGQEDLLSADMDALRHAGLRVGLSTHSYWEVCRARAWGPSYIACGPIHATTTKDMPWRPQGPGNLAYWCRTLREPVVAIAGMDAQRSHEAVRCGVAGVAVLRGIVQASEPERVIQDLRAAIALGRSAEPLAPPELPRSTFVGAWHDRGVRSTWAVGPRGREGTWQDEP